MLPDIVLIVIKYLKPTLISSFLLRQRIGFDVKFRYDASHWQMSDWEFNSVFGKFANVVVCGLHLNSGNTFCNISVPIVYSKIKNVSCWFNNDDIIHLEKCVNLRRLNGGFLRWSERNVKMLSGFRKMRHLFVSIYDNYVIEPLINSMPNLRSIYLSPNRVSDFENIMKCRKLKHLMLFGHISDNELIILNKLNKIRQINIMGSNRKIIPDLSGCCELRHIVISNCDHLSSLDNLRLIKQLRSIKVSGCQRLADVSNLNALAEFVEIC